VLPARYGRGLPKFDIGMVLLARFAIADERQGQGLGRDLLIEAIERAADAGTHVAARFIAVDPIDEAARAFYAKFGFRLVEETWKGACTSESTRPWPPSADDHDWQLARGR